MITIDRAIEILDPEHRENYDGLEEINEACRMGMEALKQSRWIPCTEHLPDELVPVNVVWVNRDPPPYYRHIKDVPFSGTAVLYDGNWYWESPECVDILKEYGRNETDLVDKRVDITKWKSIPEPPKEGSDKNG